MLENLHINIYVTSKCNRSCPTCYYPHSNNSMTKSISTDVANWIRKLVETENVKYLRCHFLGGEPTFNLKAVFNIADILKDVQGPPEGKYVIFTNGDSLVDEILKEFKHRQIRVLLNPTDDPLYLVEDKILQVKDIMGGCSLAICLDQLNLQRLPELTKLALRYKCHIRTNRLYNGGSIPGSVDYYQTQMVQMFKLLLESDWKIWPNFIMETTTPTWEGEKNPNFCGKYFIVIDPDGSIRSCNADLSTVVGNIYTHHRMKDFKFTHRWSSKGIEECQECEYKLWCQSGCPLTRKLTYGTYDKRSPFCSAFKVLFPILMVLTKKWKDKKVY